MQRTRIIVSESPKGAAYSGLLSLFPILTVFTAVLIQANAQSVVHVIERFVQEVLPPGTEDLVLSRLRDQAHRGISLPVYRRNWRHLGRLWRLCSLMEGFQAAYRIPWPSLSEAASDGWCFC